MATQPPGRSQTPSPAAEIRIANRIPEIARVAALVDDFAARHALPDNVLTALNVSLDEILNNIISYGYEDEGYYEILVRLVLRCGKVEVLVEDDGKPFDPTLAPAPSLKAESRVGGVGIHFVRSLTDHLEYTRRDDVNQLRFVKKIQE